MGWFHLWFGANAEHTCGKCGWSIRARADVAQESFRQHLMDHDLQDLIDEYKDEL